MNEAPSSLVAHDIELRSDDVQEILGQIPPWIIRWGILLIVVITMLLLIGSWFFQYPDIVVSSIIVTTTHPPSPIIARSDGKIERLLVKNQQRVAQGELLACLENTARYEDVIALRTELNALQEQIRSKSVSLSVSLEKNYTLGTLHTTYANVLATSDEYADALKQTYHQQSLTSLDEQIRQYQALSSRAATKIDLLRQEFELSQRQYARYQHLREQDMVSEKEMETFQSEMLQKRYALEEVTAELDERRLQIEKLQASKSESTFQYDENIKTLGRALQENVETLVGEIVSWEHANLFYASIDGTVTFTEYWSENQHVKAGDVVMTIVPDGSNSLRGSVRLPVHGAGNVAVGQHVNIKFANYPYTEYGMATGYIEDISLVPSEESYIATIRFPDGLTTSYGNTLHFTQEMQGTAEIITENRRLFERLLQPLRALITDHVS